MKKIGFPYPISFTGLVPLIKGLFSVLIIFTTGLQKASLAQNYGNEWINYSQQYFAMPIHEEGVYRVSYNTLQQAGVPLGTFDPRSFQVFANGEEQPVMVSNEDTGIFQAGDYIEFYAHPNTGWFDRGFYPNASKHPNPDYSLINDTITYYLTWTNQLNNKRFQMVEENDFSGYTPADYNLFNVRQNYTSFYYSGETNNYGVTVPDYVEAEGWFDQPINVGGSKSKTLPTTSVYTPGPDAEIEFAIAGASNFGTLNPDHHLQVQFAGEMIDTLYEGYKLLRFNQNVAPNRLNNSGTPFIFSSINSLASPVDRSAIAYISVTYPRVFNFEVMTSTTFTLPISPSDYTYIELEEMDVEANDPLIFYNLTTDSRSTAVFEEDSWKVLIPQPNMPRQVYVTSESQIKTITNIYPVTENARFTNFAGSSYSSSGYIIISHPTLWEEANQYKSFRESTGFTVTLADIEELYHQFAYGIKKHPLSIRNFLKFAIDNWEQPPGYLFLIGKGLTAPRYRNNQSAYEQTLIPSYGNPASDVLLSSGLDNNGYAPALATGRLAAKNPTHVTWYHDKAVQHHEAQKNPQEWMKNILHFGGGSSVNEQNVLKYYLQQYESILSDTLLGGYIRTFLKSSTDPIQINQSDSLKQIINNGVTMMVFFGHASGIGFDISIDYPSEYSNFGKYPFLVANSCFAGDIFGTAVSSSEEFVLIQEKGVIGYIAATTATGASELNIYSNEFFRNLSVHNYGKPVGYSIRETIRNIQSGNPFIRNVCLLKTLHGDPAVILNSHKKPDYTIESKDIFYSPEEVTAEMDSFNVHIITTNIGKAIKDSIFIDLTRTYPDGSADTYQYRIGTPSFKDTISIKLPVNREIGTGVNQLSVVIDALNEVDELNLANNSASNNMFIRSSDVIPVLPYRYAIVGDPGITLYASTGDPFTDDSDFIFEMDTSELFINPIASQTVTGRGVIQWEPPVMPADSMVWYWRVAAQPAEGEEPVWRYSSFQYIAGETGWSQAHFPQFENNDYTFVSYNKQERQWDFVNSINVINAQTGVYPYLPWNEQFIRKNNVRLEMFSCLADVGNGVYFAVFDPVSADHWVSQNQGNNLGQYDNFHCRQRDINTFDYYSTTEEWRQRMTSFIDTIPQGHYVLAVSHRNHNAENFPEELYQAFESLGSANIRSIPNNTPYLLFGMKGSEIGSANEVIGSDITSVIQITDSVVTNWDRGVIVSEPIGPASLWEKAKWNYEGTENNQADSVWIDLLGIRPSGDTDTLLTNISGETGEIDLSEMKIDPLSYPYLQLVINMRDEVNRTPAQMDFWQVTYQGIPETTINPSHLLVLENDTIQEGKPMKFATAIENISDYDMDSLLINYWVVDKNRQIHPVDYPRQAPHPAGDIFTDTLVIETLSLAGNNELWMEVNPANDQIEQYLFNNIGQIPFFVEKDKTNPIMEVTFDGVQIMDGEIVSANPFIHISVSDENNYLALDDTTLVKVFLSTPANSEFERIYFNQGNRENMRFYPATTGKNSCSIELEPAFELDGEYRLRVQATDRSQNESGTNDYVIGFEVVTRSTITELLNWPNPFTTKTHFVFTLTGSQLPDFMKIQILTITGKVVREIDMTELGPLRIGKNITEYAWDGTDEYGNRLANGVYLYRVMTHINGEQIELKPTDASQYFKEGFGKMYLMR